METKFYQQNHSIINGRNVWHYLITTPVGDYHLIHYEQQDMAIKEFIIPNSNDKAEKKFDQICIQMVKGRI